MKQEDSRKVFNNLHTQLNSMFDGMHHQDQLFHQFISSSSSPRPPPSSSSSSSRQPPSLHHQHHLQQISNPFPKFDNSSPSFPTPSPPHNIIHNSIQLHDLFHRPNLPSSFPHHLNHTPPLSQHHLTIPNQYSDHQQSHINTDLAVEVVHHQKDVSLIRSLHPPSPSCPTTAANFVVDRERLSSSSSSSLFPQHHPSLHQSDDIWSNEEVVALLRIRSTSESSWFPPEFTWEHVSRKLAEIGFKRSAEKCKEKFEEESRTYFNTTFNINTTYNNSTVSSNKITNNDSNAYKALNQLEGFCTRADIIIENKSVNADTHEEHTINKNQQDMEVDEVLGCEKSKLFYNHAVSEDVRVAGEINEDANHPSPIDHCRPDQPAELHHQSDHPVAWMEGGERQLIKAKAKKRTRKGNKEQKFKIIKGLCKGFVNKMMNQQEELHNKILNDMLKRDEENVARDEAWKKMEMERLKDEIEMRVQEQAIAGDRQAVIIEFLNKFSCTTTTTTTTTSASSSSHNQSQCIIDENIVADLLKVLPKPISNQIFERSQNKNPSDQRIPQNVLHKTLEPQTPTSIIQPNVTITKLPFDLPCPNTTAPGDTTTSTPLVECNPKPSSNKGFVDQGVDPNPSAAAGSKAVSTPEDYGKRWPRDEVLALINLRCSFMTNNNNGDDDNTRDVNGSKAPLWERISQKMSELGYKRSAKRCKEKWENINKYFRKTKDNLNKKRSLNSRTCPYFHQLSHLYNQGTLIAPTNESENQEPDALEAATAGGDVGHSGEV